MKYFNLFCIVYVFGITFGISLGFESPFQEKTDQISARCFKNAGENFKFVEVTPQGPNGEFWTMICLRATYGPLISYTVSAVQTASDLPNANFNVTINKENHQVTMKIVPGSADFFYHLDRKGRYLQLYANTSTSATPSPHFHFKLETPSERHGNCLHAQGIPPSGQHLPMIILSSNESCNH